MCKDTFQMLRKTSLINNQGNISLKERKNDFYVCVFKFNLKIIKNL